MRRRLAVLAIGIVLLVWGVLAFRVLSVEAYPDLANTIVQVITQWPGHSAEEIEQQITIRIEEGLTDVPNLYTRRSTSLSGLSVIELGFDNTADHLVARQQILVRLADLNLPPNIHPRLGPDSSPLGQIYCYTLTSSNSQYDVMELKALQEQYLVHQLKSVPNVVDVSTFGGTTREYEVRVDPVKLLSHGLTVALVEQALTSNNISGAGSFIERGEQSYNVHAIAHFASANDIGSTVLKSQSAGSVRVRDVATVVEVPKPRIGQVGKAIRRTDGKVVDENDLIEGIVLLRKDADPDKTIAAVEKKVGELNLNSMPPGVRIVPHMDRADLVESSRQNALRYMTIATVAVLLVVAAVMLFLRHAWLGAGLLFGCCAGALYLLFSGTMGFESLLRADEGTILARETLPPSIGLKKSAGLVQQARSIFASYPEVTEVVSHIGRPDDGTNPSGFFNAEYFINLKPHDEWRPQFRNEEQLISAMRADVRERTFGAVWNFSQPVQTKMEEAITGVKSSLAVKLFGDDLRVLEQKGNEIVRILSKIPEIEDLGLIRVGGQPGVQVVVDQSKTDRFGINLREVQDVIEAALGGKAVGQIVNEDRRFDVIVRFQEPYQQTVQNIAEVPLLAPSGQQVVLSELSNLKVEDGASAIYREDGSRYVAITYGVRGHDRGRIIRQAVKAVAGQVNLPPGYRLGWTGEYPGEKRWQAALAFIFPIVILIILLYPQLARAWRRPAETAGGLLEYVHDLQSKSLISGSTRPDDGTSRLSDYRRGTRC